MSRLGPKEPRSRVFGVWGLGVQGIGPSLGFRV